MGLLNGKVALITGGASGIGERTAELFVQEGAKVLIADILEEEGRALADRLDGTEFIATDVTQEDQVRAAVDLAVSKFGRLDCMFNNAGAPGVHGPIELISVDGFDRTVAVLLRGVMLGMKWAAPVMKAQGSGVIINTGSIAGIETGNGPHIYSAMKAAVIHLTKSVATELGEHNIRVNCICPGVTITPILYRGFDVPKERIPEIKSAVEDFLGRYQPIARPGQPDDIAQAVLWLASDLSGFVNGHAMVVDGGKTTGGHWLSLINGLRGFYKDLQIKEDG